MPRVLFHSGNRASPMRTCGQAFVSNFIVNTNPNITNTVNTNTTTCKVSK